MLQSRASLKSDYVRPMRNDHKAGHKKQTVLTVQVLPVADVLEVAARVLAAEIGLRSVGLEPRVVIPSVLGARRHAAGRCVPHDSPPAVGSVLIRKKT